jgi:hypothetical protein
MWENFGKPGHYGYVHPCGCVNTRDFKGYGVRQLCGEHFAEAAAKISQPAQ